MDTMPAFLCRPYSRIRNHLAACAQATAYAPWRDGVAAHWSSRQWAWQRLGLAVLLFAGCAGPAVAQVATSMTKKAYDPTTGTEITTPLETGDTIRYVIAPSLPLTSAEPTTPVPLTDTMQGSQTYVAGSLDSALNWTLPATDPSGTFNNTLIATWTPPTVPSTSGSTMTQVYAANAFEARLPVAANFSISVPSGGGDGYTPFTITLPNGHLAVMTVNHHVAGASIVCVDITLGGGVSCSGGAVPLGTYTSHAWEFVQVGNKIFYPMVSIVAGDRGTPGIGCLDISTNVVQNCATPATLFPGSLSDGYWMMLGVVQTAGKVCLAFKNETSTNLNVGCIAPASQAIVSQEVVATNVGGLDSSFDKFVWLGGSKWVVGYGSTAGNPAFVCLSMNAGATTAANCNGTTPVAAQSFAVAAAGTVSLPRLDAAGNITGFCVLSRAAPATRPCYDLNGAPSGTAPAALVFPGLYSWYYAIPNSPLLLTFDHNSTSPGVGVGGMRCFNWSTGSTCATPHIPLGNGNNLIREPYGADQLFPNTGSGGCYVTYGDTAVWELWTITANGTITEGCLINQTAPFVSTVPDPSSNVCGPGTQITAWDQVILTGMPIQSGSTVEFLDLSNNVIATTALPATATANSTTTLAVPPAVAWPTYISFRIRVTLRNVNAPTAVTPLIRTTYLTNDGSTPQICFNAQVTTCAGSALDNLAQLSDGASGSASVNGTGTLQCQVVAELSVTKTNTPGTNGEVDQSGDTVTRGTTTTYTIIATNNGPDAVTGAVVRDPAQAGLICNDPVLCTGSGCPSATVPLLALQSTGGVVLGTVANGGTVSFSLSCAVQ